LSGPCSCGGEAAAGLPVFCLERWQSERETSARYLLSESGVAPLRLAELEELVGGLGLGGVELGYGWTRGSPGLRRGVAGSTAAPSAPRAWSWPLGALRRTSSP